MTEWKVSPALRKALFGAAASVGLMVTAQAHATAVLNFEGLLNGEQVLNYYNGGTGGEGSGPGTNYGVAFGNSSLAIISETSGGSGNFVHAPGSNTILFFLTGADQMNVAAGFKTGFSFYYAAATGFPAGTITVNAGLSGTGGVLASLTLPDNDNTGACGASTGFGYCTWDPVGVNFAGTAESVTFGGAANFIGFDEITIGSATAGGGGPATGVPEPTSLALLGSGLFGLGWLRRRRRA